MGVKSKKSIQLPWIKIITNNRNNALFSAADQVDSLDNSPEILQPPPPQPASAPITGIRQHAIGHVFPMSLNNAQSNNQSHLIVHWCQHKKLLVTQKTDAENVSSYLILTQTFSS